MCVCVVYETEGRGLHFFPTLSLLFKIKSVLEIDILMVNVNRIQVVKLQQVKPSLMSIKDSLLLKTRFEK